MSAAPALLTPDDAAARLKAILRRHIPADPMTVAATHRLGMAAEWSSADRLRQIRAVALEVGEMPGATTLLCRELRVLREDITRRLGELWR